jgi:hypothetical protein
LKRFDAIKAFSIEDRLWAGAACATPAAVQRENLQGSSSTALDLYP